jgi:hypothetical protein
MMRHGGEGNAAVSAPPAFDAILSAAFREAGHVGDAVTVERGESDGRLLMEGGVHFTGHFTDGDAAGGIVSLIREHAAGLADRRHRLEFVVTVWDVRMHTYDFGKTWVNFKYRV